MNADTIYLLEKGKIVEEGSYENLLALKGLYYAMWRQQIEDRKTPDVVVVKNKVVDIDEVV
ncbi:MAG: hypothetical protein ABI091_12740 [Ferruginibacter sp.]